jgi:putative endonuclease
MTDTRRIVGDAGEDAVAAWYEAAGYSIVARNWRVRAGELDVIARRGSVLVFCEAKTRRGDAFGIPAEAVTARKQARIRGLAAQWLAANRAHADVLRFDVACVRPDGRGRWIVDVIEAAF